MSSRQYISAKVEYLYMDFGKETYLSDIVPGGPNFESRIHTGGKAGINDRF